MKLHLITRIVSVVICGLSFGSPLVTVDRNELAAMRVARYLLNLKTEKYTWGDLTPRIFTSLSYLKKLKIHESDIVNVLKHELLQLLQSKELKAITAVQLSHFINGLYATCEDPREFAGVDLVEFLNVKYKEKADFKLPIVILSLCIAREATLEASEELIRMYDGKNDNIAFKALTLIAMASCKDLTTIPYLNEMKNRLSDFWSRYRSQNGTGMITKALTIQAFNAWRIETASLREQLQALQDEDGSFGHNLLATVTAIPALLNSSLAELQCKTRSYKEPKSSAVDFHKSFSQSTIYITTVLSEGENIGHHTVELQFTGRKSLYKLMLDASQQNALFNFQVEEIEGGKRIIAFSGISNDPESGMNWGLYKITDNTVNENRVKENDVVDYIYPKDGDHYLLQMEMA